MTARWCVEADDRVERGGVAMLSPDVDDMWTRSGIRANDDWMSGYDGHGDGHGFGRGVSDGHGDGDGKNSGYGDGYADGDGSGDGHIYGYGEGDRAGGIWR